MAESPILSLDRVSRVYRAGVAALSEVTLSIKRGEHVAITGPSGCGKSTLLYVLCGLDQPTSGRALFQDQEPSSHREWARLRARRIGFVFQAFHLLPTLTAAENVEIPMFGVERDSGARRERALSLLSRVGLAARVGHRPGELSGGECQRVAIARSLANGPDVILADEPTGNLDSATSSSILDLLSGIRDRDGTTMVVATHDTVISSRAERVVRLLDGRILE